MSKKQFKKVKNRNLRTGKLSAVLDTTLSSKTTKIETSLV